MKVQTATIDRPGLTSVSPKRRIRKEKNRSREHGVRRHQPMHHFYLWNHLPSSFRQPYSVHCPPGSPHPAHITSSQSPPSLSPAISFHRHFTPDYKLISFTNPFVQGHSYSSRTAFTDLEPELSGQTTGVCFVLVSSFKYFFLLYVC